MGRGARAWDDMAESDKCGRAVRGKAVGRGKTVRDDSCDEGCEWEAREWARAMEGGEDEGRQGEGQRWW